jgi:hypothetical protein
MQIHADRAGRKMKSTRGMVLLTCMLYFGVPSSWADDQTARQVLTSETSTDESSLETSPDPVNSEPTLPLNSQKKRCRFVGRTRDIQNDLTIDISNLLFWGSGSLEYERMISQADSLAVCIKAGHQDDGWWDSPIKAHDIFGIEGLFRMYLLDKHYAPRGLWIAPAIGFTKEYYSGSGVVWNFGSLSAKAGWKFIFGGDQGGVMLSPFIGLGYTEGFGDQLPDHYNKGARPYSGFYPSIGIAIGPAF